MPDALVAPDVLARLEAVARDSFGWEELWSGQAEAMASVLSGCDTLAVMPTGAGKSAVYQVPAHHRVEGSRLDRMRAFCETSGCRRQHLLAYFGETLAEPCGRCDTCDAGTAGEQPDGADSPFAVDSTVVHAEWGEGRVMRFEGDRVVVLFDTVGYRTLALATVLERELLRAA